MAASAGTVTINLDAKSVKLIRELQKASRQTQRTARRMESSMGRAFRNIRSSALTAAAAFGAFGAANTIRGITQAGIALETIERGLKAATGSATAAGREMQFLRDEAERLGLNLETTASQYTKLAAAAKGTTLEGEDAREIFTAIAEASRVMGLSTEQTGGALTAIEQIISKGKVSAEELRGQLGERLPGAFQIAARAIDKTTAELDDMLKAGKLTAEQLLPALAKELRNTFGAEVENAANDTQAAIARLSTAVFDLKTAIANSGLLDLIASLASGLASVTSAARGLFSTSENELVAQLEQQLAIKRQQLDANESSIFGSSKLQQQYKAEIRDLETQLTQIKLQRMEREKIAQQAAELTGVIATTATRRNNLTDFLTGFTIENERDRILRPEVVEDIEKLERSTRLWNGELEKVEEKVEEINKTGQELGFTFASAFEDAVIEGKKLSDVINGILKDIARIILRRGVTEPLAGAITGAFAGFRAAGGPVSLGKSYVVGENGPELFSPGQDGFITPNSGLATSAGPSISYTIDARGVDEQRIMQRMVPLLERTVETTRALVRRDKLEGLA